MKVLRHIPAFVLFVIAAVLLNYYLPDRDIVRVVGTEVKRIDVDSGAPFWDRADIGTTEGQTRDVRFINTEFPSGKTRVYRNEDTGWGFPFYFKFDSGDLTAQAQSLARLEEEQWVAVRHYGWRIRLFSIFPNATSIKRVDGPNALLIPWFNIVFIGLLLGLWFFLWRLWHRFRSNRIDPVAEQIGDGFEDVSRDVSESVGRSTTGARRLWHRLFGYGKKRD